ncbi:hypothetical protein QRX60_41725 [Amycolatopsis mongoliensis]|uniref:Uncharacterized protein n=1 Tax=Amycolatopsis mongoliensis TaxID=715475 RepID=A0A9Y2JPA0_9PSEU|nr:hypothetical protein [Amycolatopsis sp. 4-36]WIY00514.1 hypothetical protein QRX60_41725 [Amycolatopsis sp. 4-36]
MANLRDLLQRFRPAGTPGAASRPGVPADRAAELSRELEPLLALLTGIEAEAGRIREDGRTRSTAVLDRGRAQAVEIVADAEARAAGIRAEAAAHARAEAERESEEIARTAAADAGRLRALAAERMPEFADRAVRLALAELGEAVERRVPR